METSGTAGHQDSVQFWELLHSYEMKHRERYEVMQGYRSREAANHHGRELHRKVLEVMASSSRLEHKLNECLWAQEVLIVLVAALMAVCSFALYVYFSFGCAHVITAEN